MEFVERVSPSPLLRGTYPDFFVIFFGSPNAYLVHFLAHVSICFWAVIRPDGRIVSFDFFV